MEFKTIKRQKESSIAGLGTGQTDWTIPANTKSVQVIFTAPVEASSSNDISFRDASSELLVIGNVESQGIYTFEYSIPDGATIVRVEEDNGDAAAQTFYQEINFIVQV